MLSKVDQHRRVPIRLRFPNSSIFLDACIFGAEKKFMVLLHSKPYGKSIVHKSKLLSVPRGRMDVNSFFSRYGSGISSSSSKYSSHVCLYHMNTNPCVSQTTLIQRKLIINWNEVCHHVKCNNLDNKNRWKFASTSHTKEK